MARHSETAVVPASLLIHYGDGRPRKFTLDPDQQTVVGRSSSCRLQLQDAGCSREHCVIEPINGEWWIRDLNSRNGTLVSGEPIRQHRLNEGDVIVLANTWMVFTCESSAAYETDTETLRDSDTAFNVPIPAAVPAVAGTSGRVVREENDVPYQAAHISDPEERIIGSSPALKNVLEQVARVAETDASILLRGESGVGKELVARAIHQQSRRNRGPFVCVNCAALTESLLESELFGHERGAFTGATEQKRGKFEQGHRGTVLLDEIGEMSPTIQAKFLRVLEGHPFERVGGQSPIRVDVRVIAATNLDLERAVQEGKFRKDLYFRLNVVSIEVPPLRARKEDIETLARHFAKKFAAQTGRPTPRFSDGAIRKLTRYDWPGNVRELRNVIESAIVMHRKDTIDEDSLQFAEFNEPLIDSNSQEGLSLEAIEIQHIIRTLKSTRWNKSRAAKILGIERSTLDRKLKRHDVQRPELR